MKYLVLGSAGQIGGHLVTYLRDLNYDVLEFDIEDDPSEDLRIRNNKTLEAYVRESDFVFFLAYDVGGSRYLLKNQDKSRFISNNMQIMSNTFEVLEKYKTPFIFASSQMAYMQNSSYGSLKRLGEKMAIDHGGVITRFWNVYGIEKDHTKSHVITDLVRSGLRNNRISVMTDGTEVRQFLYADDCSSCLHKISKNYLDFSGKTHDVSSFKWTSIAEIARIIASNLDINDLEFGNLKDGLQTLDPVDPSTSILEHWRPETTLLDGISKIIEYERRNFHTFE
jgi:nucleoside-diphosphate-sugar epimerase